MKPKLLLASLPILILTSCVSIKNANICAAAGKLSAGGICSRLTSKETNDLTFNELIDLLEAQSERTCVPVPGFPVCADDQSNGVVTKLPARGASMIISSDDFEVLITELQQACRELGNKCSYETQKILEKNSH